jgi:hypothetical protein
MTAYDIYLLDSSTYETVLLRGGEMAESIFKAIDIGRDLMRDVLVSPAAPVMLEVVPAGFAPRTNMEERRSMLQLKLYQARYGVKNVA